MLTGLRDRSAAVRFRYLTVSAYTPTDESRNGNATGRVRQPGRPECLRVGPGRDTDISALPGSLPCISLASCWIGRGKRLQLSDCRRLCCAVESFQTSYVVEFFAFQVSKNVDAAERLLDQFDQFRRQRGIGQAVFLGRDTPGGQADELAGGDFVPRAGAGNALQFLPGEPDRVRMSFHGLEKSGDCRVSRSCAAPRPTIRTLGTTPARHRRRTCRSRNCP